MQMQFIIIYEMINDYLCLTKMPLTCLITPVSRLSSTARAEKMLHSQGNIQQLVEAYAPLLT